MAPKKGSTRTVKTRPPVNLAKLTTGIMPPESMGRMRATKGDRDEQQLAFDKIVDLAWQEWDAAGRPTEWTEIPGTWLTVPEADVDSAKYLVQRAGRHYHFRIRFGRVEVSEQDGERYSTFVFVATNFPPKGEESEESEEGDESYEDEDEGTGAFAGPDGNDALIGENIV
jgi:hypothetical protein